jgi:hypothetical protein
MKGWSVDEVLKKYNGKSFGPDKKHETIAQKALKKQILTLI